MMTKNHANEIMACRKLYPLTCQVHTFVWKTNYVLTQYTRNDTFQSGSIKLTCQSVIIDTLSQCHLHNELAMHSRNDTFQSVPLNKSNHGCIIGTLSQCNLHNELAVHCLYGTFRSVPTNKSNHGCIIGTRIHCVFLTGCKRLTGSHRART